MFTKQAPRYKQQLEQSGFSAEQAASMVNVLGQCMSPLEHRGPVKFTGPVQFSQMPKLGNSGDSLIQLARLQADLNYGSSYSNAVIQEWSPGGASSSGSEVRVYPGPLLREGEILASGSLVGLIDFNGYKCPFGSNNSNGLSSIGASPDTGGSVAVGSYKVAKLTAELSVDGSAAATVQMRSGGAWIDKVPAETITVYDAFLTGDEVLPSTTRVGVHLSDQGIYVVGDAQAN